ncbi:murein L,D-transpeptidase catalytic domain family protein [Leptothoe kymatousa]|uniref:Uncharacterized protein n=1 Tax=Leptothoe kymatousa TAU-MAC 1615 TaxID=2364775 RepID=A0ABS5Y6L0_9CYAN|nr:murein L,D-transpeptidase catalytic domain family protein [Leptothoe kymatousa]MBT9313466.1 hypothetical protein [Leptothoe kymatousa TAU-MAC 1615]
MAELTGNFDCMFDAGSGERCPAAHGKKSDNLIELNFSNRDTKCSDLLLKNSVQILGVEEKLGNRAPLKIPPLRSNELD